jgi:hypothetical protein
MFADDGLWPCQCKACGHEWYSSIAAIRADAHVACSACKAHVTVSEFNSALLAARAGRYDFSYLTLISPQFRSGAAAFARPARGGPP